MTTGLPTKAEQVLAVELDIRHHKAYNQRLAYRRQWILGLLKEDTTQSHFIALRVLTTLWQMALDPALVGSEDGVEPGVVGSTGGGEAGEVGGAADGTGGPGRKTARGKGAEGGDAGALATDHSGPGRRPGPLVRVEMLVEHLGPILSKGYHAFVLSQLTRYLFGACEYLEVTGVRTAYIDGSTPDWQKIIDAFRAGGADVFLTSLKVDGFGLTLTEADYVFPLDPWWNPQVEEQTVDRTRQIGQDEPVMAYRLVSADTIGEKVMALKGKKAELFARVVEGAGEAEAGDEGASTAGGAATVVGSGGLSPVTLTAAEVCELIEG